MARKSTPLSDDELLAAIDAAEQSSIGVEASTISTDRADAIDRYLGKEYTGALAAQPGRSSVVSRDVADVVEGVLANVLKPFVGGDEVVRFDPLGPDDEERAQQETDYINWVVMERNNGFLTLNAAAKDALLLRTGYVKSGWTKRDDVILETYVGMSEDELAMLADDKDVEIVQHSAYPDPNAVVASMSPGMDPMAGGEQMMLLHDVKLRRARPTEYVENLPVPPEEILVSQRARSPSLQDVDFVQHRTHKTLSELRQLGYDVPDDITDDDNAETLEDMARQRDLSSDIWFDDTQDRARRLVLFKETWLRVDVDGDGIAELRRVCQVGKTLLANEETDIVPIAAFCPILMAHQHAGVSIYDMVEDLAKLKTALLRQFMDNKYLSNNSRVFANVQTVNIDDLLVSRPGGVVRVDGPVGDSIMPMAVPDTGPSALQGLEYLDSVRENRTGYTRQTQGLSSDALSTETLGGQMLQLSQSQLRLEMIARTIAETGVREMFRIVHALTLKHSTRAEKVRLRGKWVDINPREWVRRTDLSIAVGIGSASQQTMIAGLMMIAQAQEKAMPMGIVNVDNVYNLTKKLANAAGFRNPDEFFTAPETDPATGKGKQPPPQPPEAVQVEQMKLQADAQKTQAVHAHELQLKQVEQQDSAQKFQAEQVLKQQENVQALELQRSNDERQSQLDQQKAALESQARVQEMELERYKIELETAAKKDIEAAKIQAQMQMKQMEMQHQSMMASDAKDEKAVAPLFTPKTVIRDAGGRVVGVDHGGVVHEVVRDAHGRIAGMKPRQSPQTMQ